MDITPETPAHTAERLEAVVRDADFEHLDGNWYWSDVSDSMSSNAVAVVRDSTSTSQLIPVDERAGDAEVVGLFSFHFPNRNDNSGFVGWLATHIKNETGSGVFVVCGNNDVRGGIYDYWGYPVDARSAIVACLDRLRTPPHNEHKPNSSQL